MEWKEVRVGPAKHQFMVILLDHLPPTTNIFHMERRNEKGKEIKERFVELMSSHNNAMYNNNANT